MDANTTATVAPAAALADHLLSLRTLANGLSDRFAWMAAADWANLSDEVRDAGAALPLDRFTESVFSADRLMARVGEGALDAQARDLLARFLAL